MSDFRQDLKSRFGTLGVLVVVMLGALLIRLWTLQVLNGEAYAEQADSNRVREISLDAPRGCIYDRNGVPLVINRSSLTVTVDPTAQDVAALIRRSQNDDTSDDPTVRELEVVFGDFAKLLGMTPQAVYQAVLNSNEAALKPRTVAEDVDIEVAARVLEQQIEFPWADVEEVAVREYPQGTLAAHLLVTPASSLRASTRARTSDAGYEIGDIVGKTGVEKNMKAI